VLALVVEGVLAGVQRLVVSPGLRAVDTRIRPPAEPANDPTSPAPTDRSSHEMAGVNS